MSEDSNDYHINTKFKIGRGPSAGTPNRNNMKPIGIPLTPNTPDNIGSSPINRTNYNHSNDNHNGPSNVAKATPRMMGSRNVSTSNAIENEQYDQTGRPLMPPVDLNQNANNNNNNSSTATPNHAANIASKTQSRNQPPKQFHRKSLGDWDFLETVGAGSMGKVKLARHHKSNEVCAIKIVNRATKSFLHKEASMQPPKSEQEVSERQKNLEKEISRDKRTIREASLGQVLYHPHICRLFEMCTMSNHFYMLFEYVSGGQLLDYIIQHGSLREHHARKFTRGIASALQYLHGNNIVHRDLKIENIMISTSGEIKIIDFGLSNLYDNRKQLSTFCGSLYFAAPELLKANPYIGPEVDVWSFGVVLYVLVCGKVPFDDENSSVLHEKIKQGKVEYPQHLSIEVISLLSKMLVVDPKKRASLSQIVNHPWMVRGFDSRAPSYLPSRIPMTLDMINQNVIKEMFQLEFIDDVEESLKQLKAIITDDSYLVLSNQYWQQREIYEKTVSKDLSFFEDPTRAFHPLLSIYYLVDEMLRNKLLKLQRKQQLLLQKQKQQEMQQLQLQRQQQQNTIGSGEYISQQEDRKSSNATAVEPKSIEPLKTEIPNIAQQKTSVDNSKEDIKGNLKVVIPPKLVIPEQAHTSPTSRKSPEENRDELDYVFSPNSQHPVTIESRINSAQAPPSIDNEDRSTFGGIFRRLSQRRSNNTPTTNQVLVSSPQKMQPQLQIKVPNEEARVPARNTHQRTFSEHVPSVNRVPSFSSARTAFANKITSNNMKQNTNMGSPMRSASQKQDSTLPALPSNAEDIVQQQLIRHGVPSSEHGNGDILNIQKVRAPQIDVNQDKMDNESSEKEDVSNVLENLSIPKGRKLHPSARAKSVGHARRESLKFSRPPVPTNIPENDNNEYLENNVRNDLNNQQVSRYANNSNNNMLQITKTPSYIHELTDEQILDEASKAPAGSMPSIDYPRSLFLKGFFSVQTTSSKPLPIVRYKIMSVLKRMNISFNEVKGGFVCVQDPVNIKDNVTDSIPRTSQEVQVKQFLQPPAATHRRIASGTPQLSIRRQGSNKYTQPTIPASPLGLNADEHRRSFSSSFNANAFGGSNSIGGNSGNTGINSEDMSTASLDFVNQEDILTTSRVQDMNRIGSYNQHQLVQQQQQQDSTNPSTEHSSKERPPIKFEIYIVKVRIVGLAGVHFKKVSGNTWMYKELASHILSELNL